MKHNNIKTWLDKDDAPAEAQPLMSHLQALRKTIMVCLIAYIIGFLIVFLRYSEKLVQYTVDALRMQSVDVIFTDVSEAFAAQLKLSLIAGAVISAPVIIIAVWMFVRPALSRRERFKAAVVFFIAGLLFVTGIYFAYRFVLILAVRFFLTAGTGIATPMISLGKYVNFLFAFLLPFGVMFELPIVVVWLTSIGLVKPKEVAGARKYVILGLFVISAVLTPPDVVSQVMLGVPMCVLFEVGIIASRITYARKYGAETK